MNNSSIVDELNKSLIGVTPISDIVITQLGHKSYYFRTPYGNKKFSSIYFRSKLMRLYNKSVLDLILDINNISIDELPKCRICGINPVSLCNSRGDSKRLDLLSPRFNTCCSDKRCSTKNSRYTQMDKGTHVSQRSPELRSKLASKANKTKVKNGTHVSQTHGHFYKIIRGIKYHFSSNVEYRIYKRFYRILNKYYDREKYISEYSNRSYSADYVLKPIYEGARIRGVELPKVIEVKSNSLFYCKYLGSRIKNINYDKFKSVIDMNYNILIIDNHNYKTDYYYLSSIDDLNKLFKV